MRIWPGKSYPLGATWDGNGVNFAIFSECATGVELCLSRFARCDSKSRIASCSIGTSAIWSGTAICPISGRAISMVIASKVPTILSTATASIPTRSSSIPTPRPWAATCSGVTRCSAIRSATRPATSFDDRDNRTCRAAGASSSIPRSHGATIAPPRIPGHETIIYELHVKGFTKLHPEVPPELCAGLAPDWRLRPPSNT